MPALRPAKAENEGPESPEALFISAMIDSGQFTPEKFRITVEHLSCWQKLYTFAADYQQRCGEAPPIDLVKAKFPDFEFREGGRPEWTAHELHQAYASRQLRLKMRESLKALDEGDLEAAYGKLEEISRPKTVRRKPASVFEHQLHQEEFDVPAIEVPYQSLGRYTGGIYPGDLWYIAGRPGTGKTWDLCSFSGKAVSQGCRVRYLSLEMRTSRIAMRALKCMANAKELEHLVSKDPVAIKKAIDAIQERMPGSFEVVDPSHGRVTTTVAREYMDDIDLLVIDHAGLMFTPDGRRAHDDWRAMAIISNMLKEYALETAVPILAGAQLNRTADQGGQRPPKISQLAQSDALGQDADVVVTRKRLTKHVVIQSAEKVREGEGGLWYSRFDPAKSDFRELKKDEAMEIMATDEDFDADQI
jgi:hypothetical protein